MSSRLLTAGSLGVIIARSKIYQFFKKMSKKMLTKKSLKLAAIGMLVPLCIFVNGLPGNSQESSEWRTGDCSEINCEFNFGQNSNYRGMRELVINRITGNGGNVSVQIYDGNNIILNANPGVGGRELFAFDGKKEGYKIFIRPHNAGSSVSFSVGRAR